MNVANLGRRPYRSLSADVIQILQNDLGLLLRGEVIWVKGRGSSGSCAWGSFKQATNPVLRDISERVIIASKGRFDRATSTKERQRQGLPSASSVTTDEFMEATLDVWEIPAERATRVGHPAPFPVELPQRLIELYTFRGDLVLDPFMGSGSTLVAAAHTGRSYVGCDMDEKYVAIARARVAAELAAQCPTQPSPADARLHSNTPSDEVGSESKGDTPPAAVEGKGIQDAAHSLLSKCGFEIISESALIPRLGVAISLVAKDKLGQKWHFDLSGAFTTPRAGLIRSETLWKSLGKVLVLTSRGIDRVVLLTTHLPPPKSAGDAALRAVGPERIFDIVEINSQADRNRLSEYSYGTHTRPLAGFWTVEELRPQSAEV